MNIIRQREFLKGLYKDGVLTYATLARFLTCPVFEFPEKAGYRDLSDDELDYSKQLFIEKIHYPFRDFRLFSHGYCMAFMLVKHESILRHVWQVAFHQTPDPARAELQVRGTLLLRCFMNKFFGVTPHLLSFWLNQERYKQGEDAFVQFQNAIGEDIGNIFCRFLLDVMTPSNSIIRVEPERNGKSVEWRLARRHYVILNNRQARLCQKQTRGPSTQQLIRAAHWRRAHFRRLRSDCFKHKQGQLVAVCHAWVGPKEWQGLDRKVYKVMEPREIETLTA